MSYTVLARKWRPRSFADMVGQEHVIRALVNALDGDRLHHAFLFTGTRGVGKTTIARILAKCLNCESGVTSRPCDQCAACDEIDAGRFVDLIEVDAASRTKVDDTRELLDNVQYAPTRARYKVYLIDEVHMLSRHSFNALLKTLEEPPPHVKFLLATTNPEKLLPTVLSRCLQFNLKRLPLDLIAGQLRRICTEEDFGHDEESLTLLARAADGSMRDALSLLDQGVAFGGGALSQDDVRLMLGTVDRRQVVKVLDGLASGDAAGMMAAVADMDQYAPDYGSALADIARVLQRAALAQAVPEAIGDDAHDADLVRDLAARIGAEDLQLYYQIALLGRRDLALAPDPRGGFEMVLLRMLAFRIDGPGSDVDGAGGESAARAGSDADGAPAAAPRRASATHEASVIAETGAAPPPRPEVAGTAGATPPSPAAGTGSGTESGAQSGAAAAVPTPALWQETLAALPLHGAARQLAAHCLLQRLDGERVVLTLARDDAHFLTDQLRQRVADAFAAHLGHSVHLSIEVTEAAEPGSVTPAMIDAQNEQARTDAARRSLESDPNVRALKDAFNATLEVRSVKPLD